MRPASLAETSPFYVPGPCSGWVVAVVLLSELKFDEKRWHSMEDDDDDDGDDGNGGGGGAGGGGGGLWFV